jgi:hypothetical protein
MLSAAGCGIEETAPLPTDLSPALVVAPGSTPIQVYGAWHCGNDYCTWATPRDPTDFDRMNHWLIDRGNGAPSVNLVILSFVHPLRLLGRTTDAQTDAGVPRGMTQAVVDYFRTRGIRVMLSIGGITYVTARGTRRWHRTLPNSVSTRPRSPAGSASASRLTMRKAATRT